MEGVSAGGILKPSQISILPFREKKVIKECTLYYRVMIRSAINFRKWK